MDASTIMVVDCDLAAQRCADVLRPTTLDTDLEGSETMLLGKTNSLALVVTALTAVLSPHSFAVQRSNPVRHVKRVAVIFSAAAAMLAQATAPAPAAVRIGTHSAISPILNAAAQANVNQRAQSSVDVRFQSALQAGQVPLVYVSEFSDGKVVAYPTNSSTVPKAPIETIAGLSFPIGLAVDAKGNLYVIEQGNAEDVKVFAPGSTKPFRTLTGSGLTSGVAVDAKGTVYVASVSGVLVYLKGATTPSYTLSDPSIGVVFYVAVDNTGNVIITYEQAGSLINHVGAFPAFTSLGASLGVAPRFLPLNVDAASTSPYHVAIDKYGDLLVDDNSSKTLNVGVYRPTNQTAAFFLNTGLTTAPPNTNQGVVALTGPNNDHFFVAPLTHNVLYEYSYPSAKPQEQIALGQAFPFVAGIATYPAPPVGTW
jgi:hypothetical protein